jgi:hypothetical protein
LSACGEEKRRDRAIANITFCEMYKGSTGYKPSRAEEVEGNV